MNNQNFIEGVNIIGKYLKGDKYSLAADHDEIWFGTTEGVSEEDFNRLEELGWHKNDDADNWHCFT